MSPDMTGVGAMAPFAATLRRVRLNAYGRGNEHPAEPVDAIFENVKELQVAASKGARVDLALLAEYFPNITHLAIDCPEDQDNECSPAPAGAWPGLRFLNGDCITILKLSLPLSVKTLSLTYLKAMQWISLTFADGKPDGVDAI